MTTIWKYAINLMEYQELIVPEDSFPLSFQLQDGFLRLWFHIKNTNNKLVKIPVYIVGTGQQTPFTSTTLVNYVGTIQKDGYVWHCYVGLSKIHSGG